MQLGLAIDSPKATLAVKRRLACEMVKYWQQVQESIPDLPGSDGWGKKHRLFVKWKYAEAKVHNLGCYIVFLSLTIFLFFPPLKSQILVSIKETKFHQIA